MPAKIEMMTTTTTISTKVKPDSELDIIDGRIFKAINEGDECTGELFSEGKLWTLGVTTTGENIKDG